MTTHRIDASGKTILITGATDGLGRALAGELARAGATVLLHGRDPERIRHTEAQIRSDAGSERLRSYRADFSSLSAIRTMAREILDREPRLDVLVNNAGIGTTVPGGERRMTSQDGYELRFAVNYLAGYLLTHQLLGLLEASRPARIVNVSSAGQMALDFDDLTIGAAGTKSSMISRRVGAAWSDMEPSRPDAKRRLDYPRGRCSAAYTPTGQCSTSSSVIGKCLGLPVASRAWTVSAAAAIRQSDCDSVTPRAANSRRQFPARSPSRRESTAILSPPNRLSATPCSDSRRPRVTSSTLIAQTHGMQGLASSRSRADLPRRASISTVVSSRSAKWRV